MELRAHHLLCIQGYHGVGYSSDFVENMNRVVQKLEDNPDQKIEIVKKCDILCKACPGRIVRKKYIKQSKGTLGMTVGEIIAKGLDICEIETCTSEELVAYLDQQTLKWLDICPGEYVYSKLVEHIKENLTWPVYCEICSECEWFKKDVCLLKENLKK